MSLQCPQCGNAFPDGSLRCFRCGFNALDGDLPETRPARPVDDFVADSDTPQTPWVKMLYCVGTYFPGLFNVRVILCAFMVLVVTFILCHFTHRVMHSLLPAFEPYILLVLSLGALVAYWHSLVFLQTGQITKASTGMSDFNSGDWFVFSLLGIALPMSAVMIGIVRFAVSR